LQKNRERDIFTGPTISAAEALNWAVLPPAAEGDVYR
jgi:hypothetical protein